MAFPQPLWCWYVRLCQSVSSCLSLPLGAATSRAGVWEKGVWQPDLGIVGVTEGLGKSAPSRQNPKEGRGLPPLPREVGASNESFC